MRFYHFQIINDFSWQIEILGVNDTVAFTGVDFTRVEFQKSTEIFAWCGFYVLLP